jgi:membrane-associated phospholipid phosphatase
MPGLISSLALVLMVATTAFPQSVDAEYPTQTAATEPQQDLPPPHPHTGWAAMAKDVASDFITFPKRPSTWTLLSIGAAAALATHPADRYVEAHTVGNDTADDVFVLGRWIGRTNVQVAAAGTLWAIGRYVVAPVANESQTNKVSEVGFDLLRAQLVSVTLVQGMKNSFRRDRPTGECCSLPSGHAASAFAAAAVLERHFGYRGSWPALVTATYVATSRLVDHRHFLSDVMLGSAVGTAAGWTVVGRRGRSRYTLQPVPITGGMMLAVARTPGD